MYAEQHVILVTQNNFQISYISVYRIFIWDILHMFMRPCKNHLIDTGNIVSCKLMTCDRESDNQQSGMLRP